MTMGCILFSGCFTMSDQEKGAAIIATPKIEKSLSSGESSSYFSFTSWPHEKWWEIFNAPILNDWIHTAFSKNPNLIAVQNRFLRAKEIAKIARANLFPYLYFDASDNWRYLSKNGFTHLLNPSLPLNGYEVDLSLSFTYEFDFWGKYRHLFKAAIGEALSQEAEIAETKLILAAALAQSYFAITTQMQKQKLYEELLAIEKAKYDLQVLMYEKALVNKLLPLYDEEKFQLIQQTLLAIEDEIEVERHLINIIMGKDPDSDLTLDFEHIFLPQVIPMPQDLPLELLSRRPDLMAQIWRVEAFANLVSASKADFLPNVNLVAFLGIQSVSFSNLFSAQSKTYGANPALSLPIYTSGAIRANVVAKQAAFEEAVSTYNELILKSVQEVADLMSNIRMAYQQKELQSFIVEESMERLYITQLRFEKGLDSSFNVFQYQADLINKKIKDLEIQYSQFAFIVKLMKAIGGGYQSPLKIPVQRVGPS